MPTIKDVAKAAGVSIATVSHVINNKQGFYSEETRQQVLAAVAEVGYTPNITARSLKVNQTRLIGYAWHRTPGDRVNPVLDRFTYHLAHAAESCGYHLLTFTHPQDDPLPVYDDLIRTNRVDAFIVADTNTDDPRIRFLIDQGIPFVSFGRANPSWDFAWVDTDGAAGTRAAVRHLVRLGHQRIAMIGWPEKSSTGNFRLEGYLDGLHEAHLPIREDYILRGEYDEETGRAALATWWRLSPHDRPTAILAITDLMAIGVMNAAEERGIRVGEDLAVVGYDDAPLSEYLRPALTTLQQPIAQICQALLRLLEDVIHNRRSTERHVLLAPRLVVRKSCGAR
jgi:DNA-binding LacI/PurR family transcriptional regulator